MPPQSNGSGTGQTSTGTGADNSYAGGNNNNNNNINNRNKDKPKKNNDDKKQEPKQPDLYPGKSLIPAFNKTVIELGYRLTAVPKMTEVLSAYSTEQKHGDWAKHLNADDEMTEAHYFDEQHNPPEAADLDAGLNWRKKRAMDSYDRNYESKKISD